MTGGVERGERSNYSVKQEVWLLVVHSYLYISGRCEQFTWMRESKTPISTHTSAKNGSRNYISTRTSPRDVTAVLNVLAAPGWFLLTHLYEMWLMWRIFWHSGSRFLLTHLYEMWRLEEKKWKYILKFQLTHLYEMWPIEKVDFTGYADFNSHISMRCDTAGILFTLSNRGRFQLTHLYEMWQIVWPEPTHFKDHFNSHISMRCDSCNTS